MHERNEFDRLNVVSIFELDVVFLLLVKKSGYQLESASMTCAYE